MTPERARELLADFVRGTLDASTAREVEAALAASEDLRREADALRSYFAALKGMDEVRASSGFLAKVNERIDRSPLWRRLGRAIFLPFNIKLPLELAGLAATAVLLVVVIDPFGRKSIVPPMQKEAVTLTEASAPAVAPAAEENAPRGNAELRDARSRAKGDVPASARIEPSKAKQAVATRALPAAPAEEKGDDKVLDDRLQGLQGLASSSRGGGEAAAQEERRKDDVQALAKVEESMDMLQAAVPPPPVKAEKMSAPAGYAAGSAPSAAPVMLAADREDESVAPVEIGTLRILISSPAPAKKLSQEMREKKELFADAETVRPLSRSSSPENPFADLESLLRRHHATFSSQDAGALRTYDVRMSLEDYRKLRAGIPPAWTVADSVEIPTGASGRSMVRFSVGATR